LCYEEDSHAIANRLQKRFPKFRVLVKPFDNYGVTTKS